MAKLDLNKRLHSAVLLDDPKQLPAYAKNYAGRVIHDIGVHMNGSSGVYNPVLTTPTFRMDDGKYMIFQEVHIAQFVYESDVVLDIDLDCTCEADSWIASSLHAEGCLLKK